VPKLSPKVDVVLGIKEPQVEVVHELLAEAKGKARTWMMFSHTHKGQVSSVEAPDGTCAGPGTSLATEVR